ncbi:MAG: hypothetical protein H6622_00970 [Halobacteriovoraceae bacterium]|nr:hypothetical protein [Halobacteriovoraceae bacterium]
MYKLFIEDENGQKIELVEASDEKTIEGAQYGAQALLNLFSDDFDLEDGYQVYFEKITSPT